MNTHRNCESIYQILNKYTRGRTDSNINRKWNDLAFYVCMYVYIYIYKLINYKQISYALKNTRR